MHQSDEYRAMSSPTQMWWQDERVAKAVAESWPKACDYAISREFRDNQTKIMLVSADIDSQVRIEWLHDQRRNTLRLFHVEIQEHPWRSADFPALTKARTRKLEVGMFQGPVTAHFGQVLKANHLWFNGGKGDKMPKTKKAMWISGRKVFVWVEGSGDSGREPLAVGTLRAQNVRRSDGRGLCVVQYQNGYSQRFVLCEYIDGKHRSHGYVDYYALEIISGDHLSLEGALIEFKRQISKSLSESDMDMILRTSSAIREAVQRLKSVGVVTYDQYDADGQPIPQGEFSDEFTERLRQQGKEITNTITEWINR